MYLGTHSFDRSTKTTADATLLLNRYTSKTDTKFDILPLNVEYSY